MNIWFRRNTRLDGEGAVGLLDVRHAPTEGSAPRNAFGCSILGAPERQYSCDTLELQRCRPFSAADTVVLTPVQREPGRGPEESAPSGSGRVEQYDPRLDAWLPKLDRWPRLNGTGAGPDERPGRPTQTPPPSWPASGLPAVPAQYGASRQGTNRRRVLAPDVALPGGTVGGLPFGGGLPCDGPLFGSDTTLAEMPWRAAAGEAHPMTPISVGSPRRAGRPAFDGASLGHAQPSVTTPAAAATAPAPSVEAPAPVVAALAAEGSTIAAVPLAEGGTQVAADTGGSWASPIFEQLRRETTADGCPAPPDVDWGSLLAVPPVLETAWFAPEDPTGPDAATT